MSLVQTDKIAQAVKDLIRLIFPPDRLADVPPGHPLAAVRFFPTGEEVVFIYTGSQQHQLCQFPNLKWRGSREALLMFFNVLHNVPQTSPIYPKVHMMREALRQYMPHLNKAKSCQEFQSVLEAILTDERIRSLFLAQALQNV